jgi:putative transcriptional regulator
MNYKGNKSKIINMPIVVNLDVMLAKRKMKLELLSRLVYSTPKNLNKLKSGKAKSIRFATLNNICKALKCGPADILEYLEDEAYRSLFSEPRFGLMAVQNKYLIKNKKLKS